MKETSLATRCPNCDTIFSLDKQEIEVRAGVVRCSACGMSFDAINHLIVHAANLDGRGEGMGEYLISSRITIPQFLKKKKSRYSWLIQTAYGVLATIGIVFLIGQGVYAWRDQLAVRWPAIKPALVKSCVALHCRIELPAQIDKISIDAADLQAIQFNQNIYALSLLLGNRSAFPQPYPALELTLLDAQDQVTVRRIIPPEEYLPVQSFAYAKTEFKPRHELPLRVVFENRGAPPPVNFRTGVFY